MEEDIEVVFKTVKKADFQEVQECLVKGVDVITTTAGNTCLHLAVFIPKPGLIQFLLEISASANGGPRSRVCARETLRSAPHRH